MSDIVVGTNVFADCEVPLAIDGTPVIHVAIDQNDQLKLSVQVNAPPAKQILRIVSNVVHAGDATVAEAKNSVEVRSGGSRVVAAKRVGDAVEVELDLRPLGLFIFSDDRALHVGASVLSGNTMTGSKTGIALSTAGV